MQVTKIFRLFVGLVPHQTKYKRLNEKTYRIAILSLTEEVLEETIVYPTFALLPSMQSYYLGKYNLYIIIVK